jgi:acyl-CoA thioesterase FadM
MSTFTGRFHSFTISREQLDELGHANFNELKKLFEFVRHRFCKDLKFGRTSLRLNRGIGFFMIEDSYKYLKELKAGDTVFFIINPLIEGKTRLTITLKVVRVGGQVQGSTELTNEVNYRMVMMDLKTRHPVPIPREIIDSIAQFNIVQSQLLTASPA